ncbi:hypothetical protein Bwad005_08340 [Bilophila wadsworthia]|jgi:hypothetical protein
MKAALALSHVPLSSKLPQALRERIKSLAEARNQSAHGIMLRDTESYVDWKNSESLYVRRPVPLTSILCSPVCI